MPELREQAGGIKSAEQLARETSGALIGSPQKEPAPLSHPEEDEKEAERLEASIHSMPDPVGASSLEDRGVTYEGDPNAVKKDSRGLLARLKDWLH